MAAQDLDYFARAPFLHLECAQMLKNFIPFGIVLLIHLNEPRHVGLDAARQFTFISAPEDIRKLKYVVPVLCCIMLGDEPPSRLFFKEVEMRLGFQ